MRAWVSEPQEYFPCAFQCLWDETAHDYDNVVVYMLLSTSDGTEAGNYVNAVGVTIPSSIRHENGSYVASGVVLHIFFKHGSNYCNFVVVATLSSIRLFFVMEMDISGHEYSDPDP